MKVHGIDEHLYLIKLLDFTKISKFGFVLLLFPMGKNDGA